MLVKICGLTRQMDVDAAIELGADLCGFVFYPKSRRHIDPAAAARLQSGPLRRVGVFVDQKVEEILAIMDEARLDYAQLHGEQDLECARAIGAERVIRVVWPARYASCTVMQDQLKAWHDACAMFTMESGLSGGGSGESHNWKALADLKLPKPWLLAGGLSAQNVAGAINVCHPDGVEFNSGIEYDPGEKDREKMAAAIGRARASQNNG